MKKLLVGLACAAIAATTAFAGESPDISIKKLKKAIQDGEVTVIDVNGSSSYAKGRIPGAIDFAANTENLAEKLPAEKDALIVAYCGGPACGAYKRATAAAEKLGYTNVKHLSAGISGWKSAGEEVEMD